MVVDLKQVGGKYDEFRTGDTLVRAAYDDGYWSLTVGFPDINSAEIDNFRNGAFSFTYTVIDDALFLLVKFGAIPWMDAPFEPRGYIVDRKYETEYEKGQGAAMTVFIVDSKTGELKAIRSIGLGHVVSTNLGKECNRLLSIQPFSLAEYQARSIASIGSTPSASICSRPLSRKTCSLSRRNKRKDPLKGVL